MTIGDYFQLLLIKPATGHVWLYSAYTFDSKEHLIYAALFIVGAICYETIRPKGISFKNKRSTPVEKPLEKIFLFLTPIFANQYLDNNTIRGVYVNDGRFPSIFTLRIQDEQMYGEVISEQPFPFDIPRRAKVKRYLEQACASVGYTNA